MLNVRNNMRVKGFIICLSYIFLIVGCSNPKAENIVNSFKKEVILAFSELKVNESKEISIKNEVGIDIYGICQSYISENNVFSQTENIGMNKDLVKEITDIASSQDGYYFYLIKCGEIISYTDLGANAVIDSPCVFLKVDKEIKAKFTKLYKGARTLKITLQP